MPQPPPAKCYSIYSSSKVRRVFLASNGIEPAREAGDNQVITAT